MLQSLVSFDFRFLIGFVFLIMACAADFFNLFFLNLICLNDFFINESKEYFNLNWQTSPNV